MMAGLSFTVGLPPPEDRQKQLSPNEMRQAILAGARDSALIMQTLYRADKLGLSGEDRYVVLAYLALRLYEDTSRDLMHFIDLYPRPPTVLKDG